MSVPAMRARLAVVGGGQLGRMFVHAAQALGHAVVVLEPDGSSPAGAAADEHLRAAYDDAAALAHVAAHCAAVTTEFENVPAQVLRDLAAAGCFVSPPAQAVALCQHRAREKQLFRDAGIPCAPHAVLENAGDLAAAASADLFPALLKTARLGYDGKGQRPVPRAAALADAYATLGSVPCVLEKKLPLAHEISVIVARAADGQVVHLPVQRNVHRDGILAFTEVPAAGLPGGAAESAVAQAVRLAEHLGYVGVLCVEFFVLADGSLVANEMAPRPHNSGHYSIDACDLSQFELQVRTLTRMPLVAPRLHSCACMINLLGDLWWAPDGSVREPDWPALLALPGAHLHLYGKREARRGRKMGHLTITATTAAQARAVASQAAAALGLPGLD